VGRSFSYCLWITVWLHTHGHARVAKVEKALVLLRKFGLRPMKNPVPNRCNSIAGLSFVTAWKARVSSREPAKVPTIRLGGRPPVD
jgi:hypothetical protein